MRSFEVIAKRVAGGAAFLALLLGVSTAPAHAAPAFEVQLARQASELQSVVVREATGGQFRLHFGTGGPGVAETGDLPYDAPHEVVQSALNSLTNISAGGGAVRVESVGSIGGVTGYDITFSGGPLANSDVPQLRWTDGTVPLSGPGARISIATVYGSEVSRSDGGLAYVAKVKNTGGDPTDGTPVTLEVAAPAGAETSVVRAVGIGWDCARLAPSGLTSARAVCTRSDSLGPGLSYPEVAVVAGLGQDAPAHSVATASISGGGVASASAANDEFEFTPAKPFAIEGFESEVVGADGGDYTQAGGHPISAGINFGFSTFRTTGLMQPINIAKSVEVDLPRGLVANAQTVPVLCPSISEVILTTCPAASAVGEISVDVDIGSDFNGIRMPIYSIVPEYGAPAQFAFAETKVLGSSFTLTPQLRADDGYAISLQASAASVFPPLRHVNWAFFCDFGAKVSNGDFQGCKAADDPTANSVPLVTNPTRCTGVPPTTKLVVNSWEHPGAFINGETSDPLPTGCDKVDFQPEVSIKPTNAQADTPTGVDVDITMPTDGLESNSGLSQANLDNAVVTLPRGMSLNPAAAQGLGSCTPAQVKLGSNQEAECPLSSQIGTIEIDTPLIAETLRGHVFLASQKDNPFRSTLGLYLVFSSEKDGVTIKVPGKIEPDPVTGQLTSRFVENPEAPFSRLAIKFNSGPRAPLINPAKCGAYAIRSEMSPWSAATPANPTGEEIVSHDSVYKVTSGPNGGPCPADRLQPNLVAGLKRPVAGSKSPFLLKLSREDGSQRFTSLQMSMPQGLTAYLKGVPYCSDGVLRGISGEELAGRGELTNPACPLSSQVGTVRAGAGAGSFPFYAPGRVFLAGPYKGAPLSIAVVTPAVAGPFDFGNVVVRNAVYIDPVTSQVTIKSDPIPTMVHGIFLDLRDLRVSIDRTNFMAAPTNCAPKTIGFTVGGEEGSQAVISNRFQVGECASLGFKPKLALRLFGGTKRGAHPKLRATVVPRAGDANFAAASVALPHSEFLEQGHIKTICTRVQFAARSCPAGSVYGHAEATTPLLDQPLTGPVYLRSSSNPLPDLVAALRGPDSQPIEVQISGRIDSVKGGIRTTFDFLPDQPVTTFTLTMQGGRKGLLVNSRNLCKSVSRATARFAAQNGRKAGIRPKLRNSCKKKRTAKGAHKRMAKGAH